jgi:phage terminase large subunit GpA-like protein
MNLTIEERNDVHESLNYYNENAPVDPPPRYISDYIQGRRIMPSNTPIPGPVDITRTMYAKEIMNEISPWSATQHIDLMSASQVVKTFIVENTIGYYMGALPSPMLFMSGTDALLKKWATKRLEPLIDSLGLRSKLVAPVENEKTRRTGDTTLQKLFVGGFLEMASAQSPSSQRSDSVRVLMLDEVSAAPKLLTTGEGYWDENAEARTKAWGVRRKIVACSTPTELNECRMHYRFMLGDQCEYMVNCPLCGKPILLDRGNPDGNHGLRAETKGGVLQYVYYLCDRCHDAIHEYQKPELIRGGFWEPTATPERLRRSFHLSSLLAAFGTYSWIDYWSDYQKALKSPDGMRTFTNHQDGRPYLVSGTRPKPEAVIENRGSYRIRTVPEGVLYLTAAVDVQRGKKGSIDNPPRLEMQVIGVGYGYRTWSIDYRTFVGPITDPYSGAWELLHEYAVETSLTYTRDIDGMKFPVSMVAVDSGDGENTDTVYEFCNRWNNTFPVKGQRSIMRKKNEKPDELTESSFLRYRPSKVGEDILIYIVSTVHYKNQIYNRLKIQREETEPQKPGFIDFPADYGQHYFDGLCAEEKMIDGSYDSHGRPNEELDTMVYALCMADVYLDALVSETKASAKKNGASHADIQRITGRTIIDKMIQQTSIAKK